MKEITITKSAVGLKGSVSVPGDKSISHRAVMLGSIAQGTTEITNFLQGTDCLTTIEAFRSMGIDIENTPEKILIHGKGLHGLRAPSHILNMGNSGTTTRLISGILAGQNFSSVISGDESLNSRPMRRIIRPLQELGADIDSVNNDGCAPLSIRPKKIQGGWVHSRIASAQIKSAILLAGLYAEEPTSITEPAMSRNHTELMLNSFGASVTGRVEPNGCMTASIEPCNELYGQKITVPGDISSAAYFIAAAALIPESELLIQNVGINPTRNGILRVCNDMGAQIALMHRASAGGEPVADLIVKHHTLKSTTISGRMIPSLIDELPIIAVLAAFAEGTTIIRDAAELKVKETDRIATITENLLAMGANVTPTDDGMIIQGGTPLRGAVINSHSDHRIAMAFAIAGLAAEGETIIRDSQCADISYPKFFETLKTLQ